MIDVEICLHVTWLTHSYFTRDMADTFLLTCDMADTLLLIHVTVHTFLLPGQLVEVDGHEPGDEVMRKKL